MSIEIPARPPRTSSPSACGPSATPGATRSASRPGRRWTRCTRSRSWPSSAPTASTSTTTTSIPFGTDDAERDAIIDALQQGPGRHRPGGHHGDHQPVHPPGLQGRRASPPTTATSAASRCSKVMRNIDLAAELGAKIYVALGRPRGCRVRRRQGHRRSRSTATKEAFDLLGEYVTDHGYDIRFAIEPKPNEPRGDILLPTDRPRAGLHRAPSTGPSWSASTRRSGTRRWPA